MSYAVTIKLADGSAVVKEFDTPAEAAFHLGLYQQHGYLFVDDDGNAEFIPPSRMLTFHVERVEPSKEDAMSEEELKARYVL